MILNIAVVKILLLLSEYDLINSWEANTTNPNDQLLIY